jgi:hypothetical protein
VCADCRLWWDQRGVSVDEWARRALANPDYLIRVKGQEERDEIHMAFEWDQIPPGWHAELHKQIAFCENLIDRYYSEKLRRITCPGCGGSGTVTISEAVPCPNCGGGGCQDCAGGAVQVPAQSQCPHCDGTGRNTAEAQTP